MRMYSFTSYLCFHMFISLWISWCFPQCLYLFFFPSSDEARSKKCGILVHCLAGISRSVTVTVAYLMQKRNLSLNDAYDFVKRKKSNISPNFNFMGQLLDFERTLGLNSPCDNRTPNDQLFFTTPTNHNMFQLDTLESTWRPAEEAGWDPPSFECLSLISRGVFHLEEQASSNGEVWNGHGIAFHAGVALKGEPEPFEVLQLFRWILMQLFLPLWNWLFYFCPGLIKERLLHSAWYKESRAELPSCGMDAYDLPLLKGANVLTGIFVSYSDENLSLQSFCYLWLKTKTHHQRGAQYTQSVRFYIFVYFLTKIANTIVHASCSSFETKTNIVTPPPSAGTSGFFSYICNDLMRFAQWWSLSLLGT